MIRRVFGWLRWGDFLIVALAVLLAVGATAVGAGSRAAGGAVSAEVYQNGKLVRLINLTTLTVPQAFELDGEYHNHIVAEQGRIRFDDADCPDRTCVNTGWISRPGQISACVPNRVLVKIVSAQADGEEDVIAR